jgi:hypothetical protein
MGMDAGRALAGRRELGLLEFPSVGRMAQLLAARCREVSWVRTLVPALDRFRVLTGTADLEALLRDARAEVGATAAGAAGPAVAGADGGRAGVAAVALDAFARALDGRTDVAVAGLAMGPKVWFRLNGVPVPWRPLPASATARRLPEEAIPDAGERVVLLAPVGSGLHLSELLRLRVGDLGSLDEEGGLVPDPEAEPLAVRFTRLRDGGGQRITFLSYHARAALLADLHRRRLAGHDTGPGAPVVAGPRGQPATPAMVAGASRRSTALIRAGSRLNVELCRTTGEFFRSWGLPGSHFVARTDPDVDVDGGARP